MSVSFCGTAPALRGGASFDAFVRRARAPEICATAVALALFSLPGCGTAGDDDSSTVIAGASGAQNGGGSNASGSGGMIATAGNGSAGHGNAGTTGPLPNAGS